MKFTKNCDLQKIFSWDSLDISEYDPVEEYIHNENPNLKLFYHKDILTWEIVVDDNKYITIDSSLIEPVEIAMILEKLGLKRL